MQTVHHKIKIWELCLLVGVAAALLWGTWSLGAQQALADRVVRLHVLANSDSDGDQALKLRVRDAVLETAKPLLESAPDRSTAEQALRQALPELEAAAAGEIAASGYAYSVTAKLEETVFPTRAYDDFALPAGEYLALRVVIGAGEGRNWWCVVFPPLCAGVTTDVAQTAMASGLTEEETALITQQEGYVLKFKSVELWQALREKLS